MSKLTLIAAGAAGYVLGTRAGRERYEQIAGGARRSDAQPQGAVRPAAGPGPRRRAGLRGQGRRRGEGQGDRRHRSLRSRGQGTPR